MAESITALGLSILMLALVKLGSSYFLNPYHLFCGLAAFALPWLILDRRSRATSGALICAALAFVFFGFWLLGLIGTWLSILLAVFLLLLAPLLGKRKPARGTLPGLGTSAATVLMASIACAVSWSQILAILLGNFMVGAAAAAAGWGAGAVLGGLFGGALLEREAAAGAWLMAVANVLALSLIRFFGLSSTFANGLSPLAARSDLVWLVFQSIVVLMPAGFVLGSLLGGARERVRGFSVVAAALAPLACALLDASVGVVEGLLLLTGLLTIAGLMAYAWRADLRREPVWRAAAVGSFFLVCVWSWRVRNLWSDLDTYRINQFSPGTHFIARRRRLAPAAAAQFVNGGRVLMRSSVIPWAHGSEGAWMGLLSYAVRPGAKRMLLLGLGERVVEQTARQLGLEIDAVEWGFPRDWSALFQPAQAAGQSGGVTYERWNRAVKSKEKYDVVLADLPRPLSAPPASEAANVHFFGLMKARLSDGGVCGVWLPLPAFASDLRQATAAFKQVFPSQGAWAAPGGMGILLLGSDKPIDFDRVATAPGTDKLASMDVLVKAADAGRKWSTFWLADVAPPAATRERSSLEFPVPKLLAGETLVRMPSDIFNPDGPVYPSLSQDQKAPTAPFR